MEKIQSHAKLVIVGGGILGVSLLYHLTKEGWKDLVLIEKGELTSGSTWHAAGQCPHMIGSYNLAKVHLHSTNLYKSLEKETGQATGFHDCGSLRLAYKQEDIEWFRYIKGILDNVGAPAEIISAQEIKKIHPFIRLDGIVGAFYTPEDGHTDPTSTTNAMAKGARNGGAKIYRKNRVTDIKLLPSGEWKVFTENGDIVCEHVVNAAGSFCPEVGEMVGLKNIPSINMIHHYLVTDEHAEIKKLTKDEYVQEVEGEFLDVGDALIPNSLLTDSISDARPSGKARYYLGVDVARTGRDETVYTVIAVDENDVCYVMHTEAEAQSNIVDIAGRVGDIVRDYRIETVYVDETGLGGGLVDLVKEQGLPIRGVVFTMQEKAVMYKTLRLLFENHRVKIKDINKLIYQLSYIRREYTETGIMKIKSDEHDDYPDSLALACKAVAGGDGAYVIELGKNLKKALFGD